VILHPLAGVRPPWPGRASGRIGRASESRDKENDSARFAAALRKQFGGHNVVRSDVTTKTTPAQRTLQPDGSAKPPA
jgi:hypothetical protein